MENSLKHLSEFQAALRDYKMSPQAEAALSSIKLALLVAPTSIGRSTLITKLAETGKYHHILSDTTRHPRLNNGVLEENGWEYWFRSETEFLNELKKGEFIEAALIHNQQVSGVSLREVQKAATDSSKIAITDVEIAGARRFHQLKPDSFIIFVLPPSFSEWLRRLTNRGEMTSDERHRRLESALHELNDALQENYYHFVVNNDLDNTTARLDSMIRTGRDNDQQLVADRHLISELNQQLASYLNSWDNT